jgi:predicted RNA-binding Zn-ribbon protein involved in translation (DUF1610 family)
MVFRAKYCQGLRSLWKKGLLEFNGQFAHLKDRISFESFLDANYRKHWHVHSEVSKSKNPMNLIGYLSNYVYKTAIDHTRIEKVSEGEVVFKYRSHDEGDRGQFKDKSLSPEEFLRRFTGHIQPKGFMRIRYYGFLGGGVKKKYLEQIFRRKGREYKGVNQEIHRSSCEKVIEQTGKLNPFKCPKCNHLMISPWEYYRRTESRSPPNDSEWPIENGIIKQKYCA